MGIQGQIWRNDSLSVLYLLAFPSLLLGLTWAFFFLNTEQPVLGQVNSDFFYTAPWVIGIVVLWFIIAYCSHSSMIRKATKSHSVSRKENPRIYNLVENLCMSVGMIPPKINIIDDDSLNAFASGINTKSYTISLSRGIIEKLDDNELRAVIAHELSHIRNKDVRLLIISIIFVGIFSFVSEMAFRATRFSGSDSKKDNRLLLLILILATVGYLLSLFFRFGLSRKREFLADAGSAELTHDPLSLASALEKISIDPQIEAVQVRDVAQLFIENPQKKKKGFLSFLGSAFATHPPIEKRINILKSM